MKADVLIVGAGVVGASIAWHLAKRGVRDVIVVDRESSLGAGSTSKATGGFRAQFATETNVRLSLLARAKLRAFEREVGADSGYRPHGYLFLARNAAELDALREAQEVQHECGLDEARMITAAEARELNPAIGDATIAGGAFCPTDGFIRPMNILRGYADAAQAMGVRFELGVDGGSDVLRYFDRARIVVDARGAWAGGHVTPLRRNIACTVATNVLPESMPMTIWSADWYHLRVRDGHVLLLWPDDVPDGRPDGLADDEHWLAEVLRMTHERIPVLRDVPIERCWSGLYEMSPDEHALLGRAPHHEHLYLATGSSGHGVMHAPALGQLMAELVVDGRASAIDIRALDPRRFHA